MIQHPERGPEFEPVPVEVQFGDVVQPLRYGKPIHEAVLILEAGATYLHAYPIIRKGETECLQGGGTLVLPVAIIDHWEFDRVLAAAQHLWTEGDEPLAPERLVRLREMLEESATKPPVMFTGRNSDR